MSDDTLSWMPPVTDDGEIGLRERKKRQMRAQLAAVATQMFLESGFDAVRVSEIAAACNVSEKTVFNYFPSKESLLFDRFDDTLTTLGSALEDTTMPALAAALKVVGEELHAFTKWLAHQEDTRQAIEAVRRFQELSSSTAGLRAHRLEKSEELTAAVTRILAGRSGQSPDAAEPQIVAVALTGLWRVHASSLTRCLAAGVTPATIRRRVTADVEEAAAVIRPMLERFEQHVRQSPAGTSRS